MYRGGLVRLVYDAQRNGLVVETLSVHAVVSELHAIARPYIQRAQSDGTLTPEPITLPEREAHLMFAMASDAGFKPLDGIASAPLLAEDGSLRVADGYDPLTRMWCEHMPVVEVPAAPTRQDAEVSLRRLRRVVRTFAFADAKRTTLPGQSVPVVDIDQPPGVDESAALVALLTAVCRPSLRLAPGVLIHAPAFSGAGTGKGLLVRVICAIAFGMHLRAMTEEIAMLDQALAARTATPRTSLRDAAAAVLAAWDDEAHREGDMIGTLDAPMQAPARRPGPQARPTHARAGFTAPPPRGHEADGGAGHAAPPRGRHRRAGRRSHRLGQRHRARLLRRPEKEGDHGRGGRTNSPSRPESRGEPRVLHGLPRHRPLRPNRERAGCQQRPAMTPV